MIISVMDHLTRQQTCKGLGLLLLSLFAATGCVSTRIAKESAPAVCCEFKQWTNFADFQRERQSNAVVMVSPMTEVAPYTELVLSWNTKLPKGAGLQVEARAASPEYETKFYSLGFWSDGAGRWPRESITGQQDSFGEVRTDTLVLRQPASRVQLRVSLFPNDANEFPRLKLVAVSLANPGSNCLAAVARARAVSDLPVPELSQLSYVTNLPPDARATHSDGREWCSPTCVTMVLNYWANKLHRTDLGVDVPQVASVIYDPNWPGTGNWPFNTAFAGQLDGMRAYVRRFASLSELEGFIRKGRPVIISIASGVLEGRPTRGTGHLVVCRGFTPSGDVVINHPWATFGRGQTVRRVYPRERVAAAWRASLNTAYVIFPED